MSWNYIPERTVTAGSCTRKTEWAHTFAHAVCRTSFKATEQVPHSACSENLHLKAKNLISFKGLSHWHRNGSASCMARLFVALWPPGTPSRTSVTSEVGFHSFFVVRIATRACRIERYHENIFFLVLGSNGSAWASVCCTNTWWTFALRRNKDITFFKMLLEHFWSA